MEVHALGRWSGLVLLMTLVVGVHLFGAGGPPPDRGFSHVTSSPGAGPGGGGDAFEPGTHGSPEAVEETADTVQGEENCRSALMATAGGRWEGAGSRSTWVPPDAYCGPVPSTSKVVERAKEVVAATKGRRVRLVVMGDSQGVRLSNALRGMLGCTCRRRGSQCKDAERFAGIKAVPPAVDVKIPENCPRKARDCQACQGCESKGCSCNKAAVDVDYLSMEYSKDNEQTSARFEWTQEVWFKEYLLEMAPPDMLVLNMGLHDVRRWDVDEYDANVRWVMGMVADLSERYGTKVLWLQTTLPNREQQPEKWRNFTTLEWIEQYNERASRIMASAHVPIMDTAAMSVPSAGLHIDGVHLKPVYYEVLSRIALFDVCSRRLEWLRAAGQAGDG